jgi:hypothetical protein
MVFVGIDWSEKTHDVELISESGQRLRRLRINHGVEGLSKLQETILEFAEEPSQVVVAIESDHGLLVNALVGSGYAVYPINPLVAARYRDGTRCRGPSRTPRTRSCWPTWCAATVTSTGRWPATANSARRSGFEPAAIFGRFGC